jgi:hypothetical protein
MNQCVAQDLPTPPPSPEHKKKPTKKKEKKRRGLWEEVASVYSLSCNMNEVKSVRVLTYSVTGSMRHCLQWPASGFRVHSAYVLVVVQLES